MSVDTVATLWVIVALIVVGLIVAGAVVGWERYRPRAGGPGTAAQPTNEVFIDPETGRRMRVWFDPATGTREYRED